MSQIHDYNPLLPDSQQVIPSREGGKGIIHKPGQYQNIIWQTRNRVPDGFETTLIATLETIFSQGAEELHDVVAQLNQQRVFDRQGTPWTEDSFRHFLTINGY